MARDPMRDIEASRGEMIPWQCRQRPEDPEERDIAVDPFSLRQFSRLNIDRPLPIPSVSVADHSLLPARLAGASVSSPAAPSSPPMSIAGRLKAPAAPTGWDDAHSASSVKMNSESLARSSKSSAGGEAEVADGGFDAVLASWERKANEPQRWGSDVPLIAASAADNGYSFGNARGKQNGRGKQAKHGGGAPFTCCMYIPGLTRRSKPPAPTAARSSSGAIGSAAVEAVRSTPTTTFGSAAVEEYPSAGTARPSTMSLAVSLERFDCGSLSTSSWGDLALDGEASSSSYYDLPLELILGCDGGGDESDLPVCAAFVFDSDGIRKSVLKKRLAGGTGAVRRPSLGKVSTSTDASGRISARHVRFSVKSKPPESTSP